VRNAIKSALEFNFHIHSPAATEGEIPRHSHTEKTDEQIDKLADDLIELAKTNMNTSKIRVSDLVVEVFESPSRICTSGYTLLLVVCESLSR